jgi:hypothetical protein
VFRGATLNDKAVAQPWLYASLSCGLTFGAWANLDLDDSKAYGKDSGEISEVDLSIEYALPTGNAPVGASVIFTDYTYPNTTTGAGTAEDPTASLDDDREVGLKLEMKTDCALDKALSPTLGVFYGLDGAIDKALYAELGLGHDLTLNDQVTLGLGGTLGYLSPDEGSDGLSAATISAKLKSSFGATLGVTYVIETDDDVLGVDEDVVAVLGYSKEL